MNELKQVKQFLDSKNVDGAEAEYSPDVIDMQDLIEAVSHKHQLERQGDSGSEIDQGEAPGRRGGAPDFYGKRRTESPSEVESMQKKIKRILREKDDDAEFFSSKIRQLKRQLKDAMLEKGELAEQVERLENQKQR